MNREKAPIYELGTQWSGTRSIACQWPPAWLAPSSSHSTSQGRIEEPVEVIVEASGDPSAPALDRAAIAPAPITSGPPCYPWRQVLAEWPVEWRQAWGERSNTNEELGDMDWRSAEIEAFEAVSAMKAKAEATQSRRLAS